MLGTDRNLRREAADHMVNQIKVAGCVVLLAAGLARGGVPGYKFEPGQKMIYRMDWTIRYSAGNRTALHDIYTDAVARVVQKNADGSYRIVISWRETDTKIADGAQTVAGPSSSVVCADVFPDGRELPIRHHSVGAGLMLGTVLPPLPRNEEELKGGWTADLQDFTFACAAEPAGSGFQYRATVDAPIMRQLHDSRSTRFSFDHVRGLVSQSEVSLVRDSDTNAAGTGSTRLTEIKRIGAAELKQLAKDVETYFSALDKYTDRMNHARNVDVKQARDIAREAAGEFKTAVAKVVDPDLKSEGEIVLLGHERRLDDVVTTISRRAMHR